MKAFWANWKAAGSPPLVRGCGTCRATKERTGAFAKPAAAYTQADAAAVAIGNRIRYSDGDAEAENRLTRGLPEFALFYPHLLPLPLPGDALKSTKCRYSLAYPVIDILSV
jgi:hypothetical protein